MKHTLAVTCAALCALAASAKTSTPKGFTDDLDAALRRAAENGRKVVAVFSGSDWCGWCKELDKKVLSKDAFLKVATNTYELVYIDNPMDTKVLSETGRRNNRRLTEKYGVRGFPTVLVLDAKGAEVATNTYELVYIDNPMDTKVLSETGRKNNRRITEKYGVKGFPTVLVLDAKGAEVATVSGYDGESGPEGYLKMLESEIRDAPDVKKYIKPIEDVLNRHDAQMEEDSKAARKKVREKFPEPAKDMDKKALRRYMREVMEYAKTVMFEEVYAKYIPLYEEAFAEAKAMKVPENMETRKKDLIEEQEERFEMLKEEIRKYEAEKNAPKKESADGEEEEDEDDEEEEEDVSAVRRGLDTWLKDWSENVRTNAAIETCASFRDKKLRPFLMAQMDPGGTATAEDRKVMEKSIDYIWGDGGYRSFGDRKKLVEILDRTAKKPFAAMVRALSDNKGISGPMADWIIDGDFHGEDMRCVFWTLRKNGAFGDAGANVLEKVDKSSADEWLKLILRIHVERRAAWESRGSGYANTVTEEGWEGYGNHGDACKAAFRRAIDRKSVV